ncbi:hypothetical protein [Thiosulfativibrio zosterae]|uniref:Class I SAM-dependent methyltransferase n=1 Tax=Thiosulfativibrio zosterae TaxID=2675053 RepID=A0A6F8PNK7_9GAMM|nr:hypothetical protein [Thiosulfativibrio zosterae]BBP43703.1 hypothetical protein THMIRHAT_14490 [Thiosulfativibrio zosterae]
MLWEAWQYFTTPVALPLAKEMGFLEEAIAMAARRKRCRAEWDTHFQNCQTTIREAVERCTQKRKIVIMGAGSLLDVPLDYLAQEFDEVCLIDLVFLKDARKRVKPFSNVRLIEQDVTDSLAACQKGAVQAKPALNPQGHKAWLDLSEVDCLVSLNLLSQLPLIPVSWLMKHFGISEQQADVLAKQLINEHLNLLNACSGVKCLIADRWVTEIDTQGQEVDGFDPLWEVSVPEVQKSWDWRVIPLGEINTPTAQVNRVGVSIY